MSTHKAKEYLEVEDVRLNVTKIPSQTSCAITAQSCMHTAVAALNVEETTLHLVHAVNQAAE